jgi:ribosomal peptide maturation radical SAM protein 1
MPKNARRRSIALIQVPFASHNNVSLGLIRIKSVLACEGFDCHIEYLDHELEADLGEEIACDFETARDSYWLIELLYAAQLFPDYLDRTTFEKRAATLIYGADLPPFTPSPGSLLESFQKFNQRILKRWQKSFPYDAVGINCNYNIMPALYFASSIKSLYPNVQTILGGNQVNGDVGNAIIQTFPFVDWVVSGEGEMAAVRIMNLLGKKVTMAPPNCSHRNGSQVVCNPDVDEPIDMEQLPFPDFDDFFSSYQNNSFKRDVFLSLEIGRGCYYGKCGFCGFNPLGKRYRRMSDKRVLETLEHLVKRYGINRYVFVDNLMPPDVHKLAKAISDSPFDYEFFLALQATQAPHVIEALAQMGTKAVFIGIESLATSVLERMQKGTTLFDNIVALKETIRRGIAAPYFLLTQFPGETQEEVDRSIQINRLIPHLNMEAMDSPFYIHYGCPAQQSPQNFGLEQLTPKSYYNWILPKKYRFYPTYFWDFKPKLPRRRIMSRDEVPRHEPRLELRNRGHKESYIIDTRRKPKQYRLSEEEYRALVAFNKPRSLKEAECSMHILAKLIKEGLVIDDCGKYISLAIIVPEGNVHGRIDEERT